MANPHVYECEDCGERVSADSDVACAGCHDAMRRVRPGTTEDRFQQFVLTNYLPERVQRWLEKTIAVPIVMGGSLAVVFLFIADAFGQFIGAGIGIYVGVLLATMMHEIRHRLHSRNAEGGPASV